LGAYQPDSDHPHAPPPSSSPPPPSTTSSRRQRPQIHHHHQSVLSHTPTHPGTEVLPDGTRARHHTIGGGERGLGGGAGGMVGAGAGTLEDDMAWNGDEGRFDV
ncbi:hypothetical protein HDV00_006318, partial [Rhizophlyctis rosea]